jgi:hypothetical protein
MWYNCNVLICRFYRCFILSSISCFPIRSHNTTNRFSILNLLPLRLQYLRRKACGCLCGAVVFDVFVKTRCRRHRQSQRGVATLE